MSDLNTLRSQGISVYCVVDENGIAVNGTLTLRNISSAGMAAICQVDSSGVANGLNNYALRSRGLITFCQVNENGADPVSGDTLGQLRQRGIIGLCPVDAAGIAQSGSLTVRQLQQRGIPSFCPVDETGTEKSIGGVIADFLTSTLLPSWITFTRASSATYFDATGTMQTAANDVARFDYNPATLAPKGLPIEEARTNIVLGSNDLTNVNWNLNNATAVKNVTGIDGTTSAWTLTNDATVGNHRFYQSIATTTGYSYQIIAKAGTANFISISPSASISCYVAVNLSDGSIYGSAGLTPVVTQLANGFWSIVGNNNTVSSSFYVVSMAMTGANALPGANYSGGGETVILQDMQAELGAFATSYIPTTTAPVARSADVPAGTSATYPMKAWVIEVGGMQAATAATLLGINTQIGLGATVGNALTTADGGAQTSGNTATWTGTNRGGIAFDATPRVSIDLNGGTVVTAANSPAAVTALYFGNTNNGAGSFLNGHIRKIAGYTALTDAVLTAKATAGAPL